MNRHRIIATIATVALVLAACGDDDDSSGAATTAAGSASATTAAAPADGGSITLVTYESWPDSMAEVLAQFTSQTGIDVKVVEGR